MHLHWEKRQHFAGDCHVRSLSWMGRVPEQIPQDEGWKLNRALYYQEGWLATANMKGVVGVTFTTSHCEDNVSDMGAGYGDNTSSNVAPPSSLSDGATAVPGSYFEPPSRTNYNLRGHRSEVTLVRWNEPYQKLASCDTSGIIFVWIKYEGRWSIELINDRNTPVVCFSWSHDGRMALICYQDGFVLVGSVAGQRYWSTTLAPEGEHNRVTAATWTPDDQQVYLGTAAGGIIVMDVMGNTVGRSMLREGVAVSDLAWSCERFNMEEPTPEGNGGVSAGTEGGDVTGGLHASVADSQDGYAHGGNSLVLAAAFKNGDVMMMRSYDDVIPHVIQTGMSNVVMDWSNSGAWLAVGGKVREIACKADHTFKYVGAVKFYTTQGNLLYQSKVKSDNCPVTSITWGHNDKRLFLATGNQIHVGWVSSQVASLQLLSRLEVYSTLSRRDQVHWLPLPCRIQNLIASLFASTIKSCVPSPSKLLKFITQPHCDGVRFHCTMIRHVNPVSVTTNSISSGGASRPTSGSTSGNGNGCHDGDEAGGNAPDEGVTYTLYLEHMGGFLPLLKGRKVSKIRPDFVIYDPSLNDVQKKIWLNLPPKHTARQRQDESQEGDSRQPEQSQQPNQEIAMGNQSPRLPWRRRNQQHQNALYGRRRNGHRFGPDHLDLVNLLPEDEVIAEVRANILGTRFQISSLYLDLLPPCLGQLVYKASLLHLHPRQMTLELTDLREDHTDPFGASLFGAEDDGDDDDDGEEFATLHQGISMRDNILRAVTANKGENDDSDGMGEDPNVSIVVAPLPTRLSFALPSGGTTNANTPSGDIVEALQRQQQQQHSHTHSPVKAAATTLEVDAKVILDTTETLPQSPPNKMIDDVVDNSSPHAHHLHQQLHQAQLSSPAKMRLKMSLSCDNYLGDAKLALSRRDSVGSGSPHSSRGSPRRWAAKVEEIATPTVEKPLVPPQEDVMVTSAMAQLGGGPSTIMVSSTRECRSSSLGGGLDEIVDVLGVPSDLVPPSDLNKRLVLLKEEEEEDEEDGLWSKEISRKPTLEKSKSCEGVKRRRKKRRDPRNNIELKRRSLYGRDECKGRSEDKTCHKCAEVAAKVDDAELNREIFNVIVKSPKVIKEEVPKAIPSSVCDTPKLQRRKMPQFETAQKELNKEEILFALEKRETSIQQDDSDVRLSKPQMGMPAIRENIPTQALLRPRRGSEQPTSVLDKQPSSTSPVPSRSQSQGPPGGEKRRERSASRRRFDSVRSLLEKARSILAISRAKRPTSRNSSKSREEEEETGAVVPPPCTPAVARRNNNGEELHQVENAAGTPQTARRRLSRRQQGGSSFSPARAILNSPLLRRRKQPVDSSEEELLQQSDGNSNYPHSSGEVNDAQADLSDENEQESKRGRTAFRDLESFQKQQLRYKLKKLTDNPSASSRPTLPSGQAPTPSPTPTQFLSPFLPRRAAAKMANSPLLRRKQQPPQQQQQLHQAINMKLPAAPPPVTVRRRRKLVLKNKEPMWNQTSQVYQLDFGGRVTQESAKNFQIEYKGKQVMQFGRIDSNAYTLDFQYPFTALQAFGVALANVTQRLK